MPQKNATKAIVKAFRVCTRYGSRLPNRSAKVSAQLTCTHQRSASYQKRRRIYACPTADTVDGITLIPLSERALGPGSKLLEAPPESTPARTVATS
jgi:hypothetical protein